MLSLKTTINRGFNAVDIRFNTLESNLRDFKEETRQNFADMDGRFDDLTEVLMGNHDTRIEALEEKVFS